MSRNYRTPPLIEALCEFQFTSETWDWTIPGLVYQEIQQDFPKKRQLSKIEFQVTAQPKELNQRFRGDADRIQFLRQDESALVQIGPDLLAINCLQPYPHWNNFRTLIFGMFSVYRRVARPAGLTRIGLRYINRIEIPSKQFELSDYFNVRPHLPSEIPDRFASLFMRFELPYPEDHGLLILTFGVAAEKKPESSTFILDLDYATPTGSQLPFESCEGWLEHAHEKIETSFEACITPQLRELFQEIAT